MLADVVTVLQVLKGALDIWDRLKPKETADRVRRVAEVVEQRAATADVTEVIHTLRSEADRRLPAAESRRLVSDVKYLWVLEVVKAHLKRSRGWSVLDEPLFLLVMEKNTAMSRLTSGRYVMGFVAGPPLAREVDLEFERWKYWLDARPGSQNGLLVYVYEDLQGVSADDILSKKSGKMFKYETVGGLLDLSRMNLEVRKSFFDSYLQRYGGLSVWEEDTQEALEQLDRHYLAVSGYFGS